MSDTLSPLANRFRFNEKMLRGLIQGFDSEQWSFAPSGLGGNTAHWILGHITSARRMAARMVGASIEPAAWEAGFARGGTPGDVATYPLPADLLADFKASGRLLRELLSGLGPDAQATPWQGESMPDGSNTLSGAVHFLHFHESYHMGQIGLIRRLCGLERLV